jgi:hypothetical protein
MRPRALLLFLPLSLGVMVAISGCLGGGGSAPLPSTATAREALQKSLDTWKAGKPSSSLVGEKPSIDAVDFEWKAGKVLTDFAIGEESPGQGTQTLSATLTIKGVEAPRKVQYMVLGLDPVRIYRDEDFHRALNMDDAPGSSTKPRR